MTETLRLVVDAATKAFADTFGPERLREAAHGAWLEEGWVVLEELGLPLALAPESAGGFGLDVEEALRLVGIAASHAVPLPLAETMFANHLLARAGLAIGAGPAAVVEGAAESGLLLSRVGDGWRLTGVSSPAPWPSSLSAIAVVVKDGATARLARLAPDHVTVGEIAATLTGHPCGRLHVDATLSTDDVASLPTDLPPDVAQRGGAALRAIGLAGAIQRVVELTTGFVSERVQFGRTLSKFQVVQHDIARMAGQAAAARAAADLAVEGFADFDVVRIAAAKARTGEAAGIVAAIAHQLHGAIGVTEEYTLHHLTRQLWQWRDEFGCEAEWNEKLGRLAMSGGGAGLWAWLTAV